MASITRKLAVAGALAAAVSGATAGPAAARTGDGLACTAAEDNTLTCVGEVMGATVAGRGSYALKGDYSDDSCLAGNGTGGIEAALPVITVLGERTLNIDADYRYVRTGVVRIATGYAEASISEQPLFSGYQQERVEERATLELSSIATTAGHVGAGGCPLETPGTWVEHIGLGAAAERVEANGPASAAGLRRGACANPQVGTSGADRLTGTVAGDALSGAGGADRISGEPGHDCLKGGSGADGLAGGPGHDALSGGAGDDRLGGGAGNDALRGGSGLDRLRGGPGRDVIDARDGRAETVSCGGGKDSARADSSDRLSSCEHSVIG